jgi:hypothetical protein
MMKKVVNIMCFVIPAIFIAMVVFFYFSEKNIKFINKSRSQQYSEKSVNTVKLPLLKNDTSNIIEYNTDSNDVNKKKKYNIFFDLIGK